MTGTFAIEFSWRYGVLGIYKDREKPIVRIYPFLFVRITLERTRKGEQLGEVPVQVP